MSPSLQDPFAAPRDFVMHGIRGKIEFAGPSDGTELNADLSESRLIREMRENSAEARRRELHVAFDAVKKADVQAMVAHALDRDDPPVGARVDRGPHVSGSILPGCSF